ncbi:tape measure protein [Shewanella fodinae]|uniref:tape measure protein n=1 Tax=Shewanella fodinae TaxID=552357 RepID=UPI00167403A1|nr:tape measure protein [Shewanella fodinae]MCL2905238.1 tape measure protein [Shewanella fodinae]
MGDAGSRARKCASGIDSINKSLKETDSAAAAAAATIRRTLIGAFAGISAMNIIDMADQWGQYDNRIQRATKSTEEYTYVNERLQQSAKETFRRIDETKESFINLSPVLRDMGLTLSQSIDAVDAFSGLLVVNGANAERGAAAIQALAKSMQKGKVDADAWLTIYSTADSIVDALVISTGKSAEEIRKLGAEGKITGGQLAKALAENYSTIMDQVRGMPTTVRDAFNNMNTTLSEYIGQQNKAYGVTATFVEGINALSDNLDVVAKVAGVVGIIIASRITGPLIANGIAFAGATLEAVRYQSALATMAGVSKTTAAGIGLITVASRAASGAMALLGGPVGILIAAASAMAYFALKTDSATESLDQMQQPLSKIREEFSKLNFDQRQAQIVKWSDAAASAAQNVSDAYADLQGNISSGMNAADGRFMGFYSGEPEFITKLKAAIDDARKSGDDLVPVIQKIGKENGIPQENIDRWIKLASAVSDAEGKLTNANSVISALKDTSAIVNKELDDLVSGPLFGLSSETVNLNATTAKLDKTSQNLLQSLRDEYAEVTLGKEALKQYNAEKAKAEIASSKLTDAQKLEAEMLVDETQKRKDAKKALEEQRQAAQEYAAIQQKLAVFQEQQNLSITGMGRGDKWRQQQEQELQVRQQSANAILALEQAQQVESTRISDAAYKQRLANIQYQESQQIEAIRNAAMQKAAAEQNWMTGSMEAWRNYADAAKNTYQNVQDATANVLSETTSTLSSSLYDLATGAETLSGSLQNMISGFASSMLKALTDLAAQWLVYQGVQLAVGTTTKSVAASGMVANAIASQQMAALNAYASTAAIPIVGPAAAPAAAGIALASTAPFVAAITSSAFAGLFDSGGTIPSNKWGIVGEYGPEIVSGANVTSRQTTADILKQAGSSGGNNISISVAVNAETGQTEVTGDQTSQYKQLGVMIGNAVRKIIIEEQRPMGLLDSRKR